MGALSTMIGAQVAQGALSGAARQNQLEISALQDELNAERFNEQAAEIARTGNERQASYSEKVRKFAAASENALARKNIELGSGLADQVRAENERVAALDLLNIQNNVTNQVLSMKFKSAQAKVQAGISRDAADVAFAQGLISGAMKGVTTYAAAGGFTDTSLPVTNETAAPVVGGLEQLNFGGANTRYGET